MGDAKEHKRPAFLPSRFCLLLTLVAGLFVAWWEAFHEIACGGISIRTEVPLLYTYMSCYAHAVGCAAGAVAVFALVRRATRLRRAAGVPAQPIWPVGAKEAVGLYGALVLLSVLFFLCLSYNVYAAATLVQVLFNACAMVFIVGGVAMLSCLALSDATFVLFGGLALFAVVDNLALPALVYAAGCLTPCSRRLLSSRPSCLLSHGLLCARRNGRRSRRACASWIVRAPVVARRRHPRVPMAWAAQSPVPPLPTTLRPMDRSVARQARLLGAFRGSPCSTWPPTALSSVSCMWRRAASS